MKIKEHKKKKLKLKLQALSTFGQPI
jgi:hypothetical protein